MIDCIALYGQIDAYSISLHIEHGDTWILLKLVCICKIDWFWNCLLIFWTKIQDGGATMTTVIEIFFYDPPPPPPPEKYL